MYRKKKIKTGDKHGINPIQMGSQDAHSLREVFFTVNDLPTTIRSEACRKNNWSIPTFYRKLRTINSSGAKDILKKGISQASMISILGVYTEHLNEALIFTETVKAKLIKEYNAKQRKHECRKKHETSSGE